MCVCCLEIKSKAITTKSKLPSLPAVGLSESHRSFISFSPPTTWNRSVHLIASADAEGRLAAEVRGRKYLWNENDRWCQRWCKWSKIRACGTVSGREDFSLLLGSLQGSSWGLWTSLSQPVHCRGSLCVTCCLRSEHVVFPKTPGTPTDWTDTQTARVWRRL